MERCVEWASRSGSHVYSSTTSFAMYKIALVVSLFGAALAQYSSIGGGLGGGIGGLGGGLGKGYGGGLGGGLGGLGGGLGGGIGGGYGGGLGGGIGDGYGGGLGGGIGGGYGGGYKHEEIVVDQYTHPKYKLEYAVSDPHTHDEKKHEEVRHGDVVKGYYSLTEADGTIREVHYEADKKNGFNAKVIRKGHAKHPIVGTSKETFFKYGHGGSLGGGYGGSLGGGSLGGLSGGYGSSSLNY